MPSLPNSCYVNWY